tara:strand:- start:16275 stop:16541 length:267 start_codon:yes stop_codon:yes gene_type:complete
MSDTSEEYNENIEKICESVTGLIVDYSVKEGISPLDVFNSIAVCLMDLDFKLREAGSAPLEPEYRVSNLNGNLKSTISIYHEEIKTKH